MSVLYSRQIRITVADLVILAPRISFEVKRQADKTQTTGQVNIYNLSAEHEQRIYERFEKIKIEAGYPQTIGLVHDGRVERVVRKRESLSRITKIMLGDEVRVNKAEEAGGVTSRAYGDNPTIRSIVKDLAADLNLPLGPIDAIPAGATAPYFAWSGSSAKAMTYILQRVGLTWFDDGGLIRINKPGNAQSDAPTIKITPDTGLIGTPATTEEGAQVRVFLNPLIVVGAILEIESESLEGKWKVVSLRHSADNWQGRFETDAELRELSAS